MQVGPWLAVLVVVVAVPAARAAKGGVRAGVLNSRTSRRRNQGGRGYESDWHGQGE